MKAYEFYPILGSAAISLSTQEPFSLRPPINGNREVRPNLSTTPKLLWVAVALGRVSANFSRAKHLLRPKSNQLKAKIHSNVIGKAFDGFPAYGHYEEGAAGN